jgi:hypothetical protein
MSAAQPRQAQALVLRAEVVHRPDQKRACREPFGFASERPRTPRQTAQATAEGAVEPFDERRIDPACALRRFDHGSNRLHRTTMRQQSDDAFQQ